MFYIQAYGLASTSINFIGLINYYCHAVRSLAPPPLHPLLILL